MHPDPHEPFQHLIDQRLAGESSAADEQALNAHLQTCDLCRHHLALSSQILAGLNHISFTVDPTLNHKVNAALRLRAHQLQAASTSRHRLLAVCLLACLLTAAGSLFDLRFGTLLAPLLHLDGPLVRRGLVDLWILPSAFFLVLFPLLPLLAATGTHRSERNFQ